MALKLAFRKCTRGAAALLRPCFCPPGGFIPSYLCPIHAMWPGIVKVALPGHPIFPSLQRPNISRIRKDSFTNAGIELGSNYTAHCFRRGAANEIPQSGPSLATIMKAGWWNSGGAKTILTSAHPRGRTPSESLLGQIRHPLRIPLPKHLLHHRREKNLDFAGYISILRGVPKYNNWFPPRLTSKT